MGNTSRTDTAVVGAEEGVALHSLIPARIVKLFNRRVTVGQIGNAYRMISDGLMASNTVRSDRCPAFLKTRFYLSALHNQQKPRASTMLERYAILLRY